MTVLLANNAASRLASSINSSQTTITLLSGGGSLFPSPTGDESFPVTLVDPALNIEIMRCTARSGDTLTVVRGQEGTAARAFTAGALVELRLTAGALAEILADFSPSGAPPQIITSATTLEVGVPYAVDTTAGAFNVTLPATLEPGDVITLFDYAGTWGTNPPTVARNGKRIMGLEEDLELDIQHLSLELVFVNSSRGWVIV